MRIVLLGAPFSGKDIQLEFIAARYGMVKISIGDLIRFEVESNSDIGNQLKALIESGRLISDELLIKLVQYRISLSDCNNGFLLENFPRTVLQAIAMDNAGISIDYIFEFDTPNNVIVERMNGRCFHPVSGRKYHLKFNPPKVEGKDDVTDEVLVMVNPMSESMLQQKMASYYLSAGPLAEHYIHQSKHRKIRYFKLDGARNAAEVSADLANILD